jgi:tetratricopeptide (TPR) repeat protein
MPLAIELAAARSRTLSLTQIAERLGDRFGLLTGGSRTALARHHTLRAVVDWSWDLLSDRERTLLRRLAVFSGGADLGSVERVCTGGDLDHGDVLDVLSGLVDKSLVEAAPAARSMRYRLLETVRAYAGERLREAGEGEAVRLRHAGTFAADAEAMNAVLRGSDQQRALDWFGRERDNLRAATRWAVDVGREDLALRLVIAPARYWTWRGNPAESREWFDAVLDMKGDADPWLRATAYAHRALSGFQALGPSRIQSDLDRARELYREGGSRPDAALLAAEPFLALMTGNAQGAMDLARSGTTDPESSAWDRANAFLAVARIAQARGSGEEARGAYHRAIDGFRRLGERWGLAQALSGLGGLAEAAGSVCARTC